MNENANFPFSLSVLVAEFARLSIFSLFHFSGNARSLWMGIAWALTSGSGVALALLLGASGPLIGVAISASLLPPVVNCVSTLNSSRDFVIKKKRETISN